MNFKNSKLTNSLVAIALLSAASMSAYAIDASVNAAPIQVAVADVTVSDETITMSARAALVADAQTAGLPVSVTTKKGVIILAGNVPSPEAGDRIVQIVASVAGVKEVRNDMKVKSAG